MKSFIIHVSTDTEREKHIKEQIKDINFDFKFINEGDKKDLTPEVLERDFKDHMKAVTGAASCAYKHILTWREIVNNNHPYALVLEDDIILEPGFERKLLEALEEIRQRGIKNFLLSLEDSNLRYVEGSRRKKGIRVYKSAKGRLSGACLLDFECAKNMLKEVTDNKCGLTLDWFHNHCAEKGLIDIYWLHPTIATQATLEGSMVSLIDKKSAGLIRKISFKLQKIYKQILWSLR